MQASPTQYMFHSATPKCADHEKPEIDHYATAKRYQCCNYNASIRDDYLLARMLPPQYIHTRQLLVTKTLRDDPTSTVASL